MKKKVVVFLCSLMAVMSLVACGKDSSKDDDSIEREWSGVYIGEDGSTLILCEDGNGWLNGGTPENFEIEWEIDDDEITITCDRFKELVIDIDGKDPDDKISVDKGQNGENWNDEKFKRTELYEED